MGLFDFFSKSKQNSIDTENIWRLYRKDYIWGFTQNSPINYSNDKDKFHNLIRKVTGPKSSAITIGASFHPYQILNQDGTDIWDTVLQVITSNNYCDFSEMVKENLFFHMNPPASTNFPLTIWKDDRLFFEKNPEFSKYVPFVIPFLVYDDNNIFWTKKINEEVKLHGHAGNYIDSLIEASSFFMPQPTFIIGADTFQKEYPELLINHYVDFLEKHIKH